jgi:hypothetical protein
MTVTASKPAVSLRRALEGGGLIKRLNNLSDLESIPKAKVVLGLEDITQAEAEAGTKTTGAMNPLNTAQAIAVKAPLFDNALFKGN